MIMLFAITCWVIMNANAELLIWVMELSVSMNKLVAHAVITPIVILVPKISQDAFAILDILEMVTNVNRFVHQKVVH